MLQRVRYV